MMVCDREYLHKLRALVLQAFGGKCMYVLEDGSICGSVADLQFAHLEETELNGRGRGSQERIYDVIRNSEKYILWCAACHAAHDLLAKNLKAEAEKS